MAKTHNKIWHACNTCGGTGVVITGDAGGVNPVEGTCKTCHGNKMILVGYIAKDIESAIEALEEEI